MAGLWEHVASILYHIIQDGGLVRARGRPASQFSEAEAKFKLCKIDHQHDLLDYQGDFRI